MSEGWTYYLDFRSQAFELEAGERTVGRSRSCDVSVNDPSVSRRHVVLEAGGGSILIKDLGSSNGTFVNGARIEGSGELRHGDSLGLGDAELGVRVVPMAAFETVRMAAHPLEPHGDATLFLQRASDQLAQAAISLNPEPEPVADSQRPPSLAGFAAQPKREPQPVPSATAPWATPPAAAEPDPLTTPVETQSRAPAVADATAPTMAAPPAPPPRPAAPPPPAPPPRQVELPTPAAPARQASPPAPAPPAVPEAPPRSAADLRLDQTSGDLLPSLDGFDVTMGPEMLAAVQARRQDPPTAATPAYNPYRPPAAQAPASAAGFGIRLLAALVDGLWMLALQAAAWFADLGFDTAVTSSLATGIGLIVVVFGWAIWGTSPGKRVCHLHVSSGDDARAGIGFPRALLRLVGYVVSTATVGIGFLMIAFSQSKRGLHDHLAGTRVERQ